MNAIAAVIAEMCPNGVEYKPLGAVGDFFRGQGLQKKDLVDEGVGCIHYGQVYTRYGTSTDVTHSFVAPDLAARLRKAKHGDLVIATTSENAEDVCKAVAWMGASDIAVSGDAYVYSHSLNPLYVAYYFQTEAFQSQKMRHVTGTKVKRLSGGALARIVIPVPPPEVQLRVAETLVEMERLVSDLRSSLEDELSAREQQLDHESDNLMTFDDAVDRTTLDQIGSLYGGLSGKSKKDFSGGNSRYVSYVDVFNNPAIDALPTDRVRVESGERQNRVHRGDVLFTASSEGAHDVGMSSAVIVEPTEPVYLNSFCFGFRPDAPAQLDPDFAKHLFRSTAIRRQIVKTANGVTRHNVSKGRFSRIEIPVPSPEEQIRIAGILDDLQARMAALSRDLRAEMTARRQQYEYYRERLLTFEEAAA